MLQLSSRDQSIIGCLRVVSAREDSLITQLRLASLLSAAQLHPAGLPASAVLFIRKVRDPLPGVLRTDPHVSHLTAVWERSVRETIGRFAGKACRPAVESVPPDAESVIFLDRSELLASIASDWCAGRIRSCWWWKRLLRNGDPWEIIKSLWRDTPEYIPAALQQLAGRKLAVHFVSSWDEAEAQQVLQRVVRSFALHALMPLVAREDSALAATTFNQPWRRWVPECETARLRPPQQLLLGIGLMIQREPARARAPGFAREVARWQCQVISPVAVTDDPQPDIENDRRSLATEQLEVRSHLDQLPAPDQHLRPHFPASSLPGEPHASSQTVHAEQSQIRTESLPGFVAAEAPTSPQQLQNTQAKTYLHEIKNSSDVDAQGIAESALPLIADLKDELEFALKELESPARLSAEPDRVKSDDLPGNPAEQPKEWLVNREESAAAPAQDRELLVVFEIETAFGGLFYLINLALYLELYGDFTNPAKPGIQLSIWDFVRLVGTELVGDRSHDDPIWRLLATLAGRDQDERAGEDFEPQDQWRLSPQWLKPFATDQPMNWTTDGGRLRLSHPDGFLVLDLSLEFDGSEQLRCELVPYQNLQVSTLESRDSLVFTKQRETTDSGFEISQALRLWLWRLMPYLKARLRRAFGLGLSEDLEPILCGGYSRVRITSTHVDVFFKLAELPVEIRLAGLDRDPGWVPAAGRFITFHYD